MLDRRRFGDVPAEVALRLLGRAIGRVGDEGPVELGKLETLFDAIQEGGPAGRAQSRGCAERWRGRSSPSRQTRSRSNGRRRGEAASGEGVSHVVPRNSRRREGILRVAGHCLGIAAPAPYITASGEAGATSCSAQTDRRGAGASARTFDERQSAQFRPLGDHCPLAAGAVHAVPESGPAHDLARHLVLAAPQRRRSGPRARRASSRGRRSTAPTPTAAASRPMRRATRPWSQRLYNKGVHDHRPAAAGERALVRVAAGVVAAVHRADRRVDLPVAADAGRGRQGARLRQVARQASHRGARARHLRGRRRRRRGQAGPAGDRRVPARSRQVPEARRPHPARRAAGRPARHRQDAARPRHRRRGERAVLHHFRLRLRRDVRRRRREPRARHVRAGEEERAVHHLHRRDRRGRPPSRRRPRRRQRRARADAQPAAGRDGRLRGQRGHHPDRRHQPPRRARPGAAASRPLRPPGRRAEPGRGRPRADPEGPRAQGAAGARRQPEDHRARHARASPAPTSPTWSTRRP